MSRNERIRAKNALRKTQIKRHGSTGSRSGFVPDNKAGSGLKKATVILPILIVLILVVILIAAFNQFSELFRNSQENTAASGLEQTAAALDDTKLLIVISPEHPLPSDYKTDLAPVGDIQVDRGIVSDLEALMNNAEEAGLSLVLKEGYVSAEQQHTAFSSEVSRLMSEESLTQTNAYEKAEKTIPAENHSEMQSGLAVKFGGSSEDFSAAKEFSWLLKNAMKYGFILRYPEGKEKSTGFSFDPAHFRYVGKENALKMTTLSMTLEEYTAYLSARR